MSSLLEWAHVSLRAPIALCIISARAVSIRHTDFSRFSLSAANGARSLQWFRELQFPHFNPTTRLVLTGAIRLWMRAGACKAPTAPQILDTVLVLPSVEARRRTSSRKGLHLCHFCSDFCIRGSSCEEVEAEVEVEESSRFPARAWRRRRVRAQSTGRAWEVRTLKDSLLVLNGAEALSQWQIHTHRSRRLVFRFLPLADVIMLLIWLIRVLQSGTRVLITFLCSLRRLPLAASKPVCVYAFPLVRGNTWLQEVCHQTCPAVLVFFEIHWDFLHPKAISAIVEMWGVTSHDPNPSFNINKKAKQK